MNHKVIVIPTISPDGRFHNTRVNANGVNLNRDWFELTQPETRAVQNLITIVDPDIVMDAHEVSGLEDSEDWRPYGAGYPGINPTLQQLADDFITESIPVFADQGWTTGLYPIRILPFAGLSTGQAALGRLGVLTETNYRNGELPAVDRVEISLQTYRMLLQFHQENKAQIQQARLDAVAECLTPGPTPIPNRQYIGTGPVATTNATGYKMNDPIPQHLVDAFGIVVDGDTVSLYQPARKVIVAICDTDSYTNVVSASPVRPVVNLASGGGATVVVQSGGVRMVGPVVAERDGLGFPVRQIVTQRDGVRYVVGG